MTLAALPRWFWPAGAALFALLYGIYYLGVFHPPFPPTVKETGDYFLLQGGAHRLLHDGVYPGNQFYPLPALLLARSVGLLGEPAGYLLWSGLSLGSLVAMTVWGSLQGPARPTALPRLGNGLLAILAVLAAHFGLHWDFRAHNVNLIALLLFWLALLAGPQRPGWAGFWLAASGALKLYALVLLPWILWRRFDRWVLVTLGWLLLFFVLCPLLVLGPDAAWRLTLDWLRQTLAMSDPAVEAKFVATLATLRSLLAALTGRELVDPALTLPLWLCRGLLVAAVAWALWRLARRETAPGARLLGEGAVLGLLPLAFSPVAQPHHAAAFLLPTLWLAQRLPLARLAQWLPVAGLLLVLVVAPYLSYLGPGPLHRGLMLYLGSLLLTLAVGLMAGVKLAQDDGGVAASRPSVQ